MSYADEVISATQRQALIRSRANALIPGMARRYQADAQRSPTANEWARISDESVQEAEQESAPPENPGVAQLMQGIEGWLGEVPQGAGAAPPPEPPQLPRPYQPPADWPSSPAAQALPLLAPNPGGSTGEERRETPALGAGRAGSAREGRSSAPTRSGSSQPSAPANSSAGAAEASDDALQ